MFGTERSRFCTAHSGESAMPESSAGHSSCSSLKRKGLLEFREAQAGPAKRQCMQVPPVQECSDVADTQVSERQVGHSVSLPMTYVLNVPPEKSKTFIYLHSLPQDIFLHIAQYLGSKDFLKLRQVSKPLRDYVERDASLVLRRLSQFYYGRDRETVEAYRHHAQNTFGVESAQAMLAEIEGMCSPGVIAATQNDPLYMAALFRYLSNKGLLAPQVQPSTVLKLQGQFFVDFIGLKDGRVAALTTTNQLKICERQQSDSLSLCKPNRALQSRAIVELDNDILISGSNCGDLIIWAIPRGEVPRRVEMYKGAGQNKLYKINQLHDGRLVSADVREVLHLWDLERQGDSSCVPIFLGDHRCRELLQLDDGGMALVTSSEKDGEHSCGLTILPVGFQGWQGMKEYIARHSIEVLKNAMFFAAVKLVDGKLAIAGATHIVIVDRSFEGGPQVLSTFEGDRDNIGLLMAMRSGELVTAPQGLGRHGQQGLNVWKIHPGAGSRCIRNIKTNEPIKWVIELRDGRILTGDEEGEHVIWDITRPPGAEHVVSFTGYNHPAELQRGELFSHKYKFTPPYPQDDLLTVQLYQRQPLKKWTKPSFFSSVYGRLGGVWRYFRQGPSDQR